MDTTQRGSMVSRTGRPAYLQIADALREQLRSGHYPPGARLPSERELIERWGVSSRTIRVAVDQLRAEGLVVSYQGRGVFVREQTVPRRLSTDIATNVGWYHTLARQGLQPAGQTTVTRAPCPPEAAEWLGIDPGTVVTVRDRIMGTEGEPPAMLATSYFPDWVIDKAPNLANPEVSGLPKWLREAFGETYSTDVLTVRMPTPAEQQRLDLPPGTPVQVIKGGEFDQDNRPLHFIEVIAAGGRIEFAYVYGTMPVPTEEG
jgi:DNA-binding GntR family transcriptional regulator